MSKITVYTTSYCPYCIAAVQLLQQKGVEFKEIDLSDQPEELSDLKKRTGWPTVPQVFIGEDLVGGYSELAAMNDSGEFDRKLGLPSS